MRYGEADDDRIRERAIKALKETKPDGVVQGMLAVQMIGVHSAVVEFLSRASNSNQDSDVTDRNVARATRLMRLFNDQCDAMQKLKGHIQQKIVVERVEVHDGGKAIVGAITAGNAEKGGGCG